MNEFNENNNVGHIQISDDVIATIVGTATLEVDGVYSLSGDITGDFYEMLGKKSFAKGITVEVTGDAATIDIHVVVRFGQIIKDVCREVQESVKTAVETMTGLEAVEINVNVTAVQQEKEIPMM